MGEANRFNGGGKIGRWTTLRFEGLKEEFRDGFWIL
jgi:hypothetical protein